MRTAAVWVCLALSLRAQTVAVPGLQKPVEILRDRWGVPHIYAQTVEDLFFAQGYITDAVADLDMTVAYATTVRPLDEEGLRALASASSGSVVLVEPYLAGTSSFAVSQALAARPHRLLSLGVRRTELRRYGTPGDHAAWQELDAAGIRRSVIGFLGLV